MNSKRLFRLKPILNLYLIYIKNIIFSDQTFVHIRANHNRTVSLPNVSTYESSSGALVWKSIHMKATNTWMAYRPYVSTYETLIYFYRPEKKKKFNRNKSKFSRIFGTVSKSHPGQSQRKGFSPVWTLLVWVSNWSLRWYLASHSGHKHL